MSGVEKITQRILEDAQAQADTIGQEAAHRVQSILAAGEELAGKKRQAILDEARAQCADVERRKGAVCDLELRKSMLVAKREVLDEIFQEAHEALSALPQEQYEAMMARLLTACARMGAGSLTIAPRDAGREKPGYIRLAEEQLAREGAASELAIGGVDESIDGGFTYRSGGMEINCTFAAIIAQERARLEAGVSGILFEGV